MLIRSQDKKDLVTLDDMGIVEDIRGYFVEVYKHGVHCRIGKYSSLKKAIMVLDEIGNTYERSLYSDNAFDNSARIQRPYIFAANSVFQMPQDDEVIV